jgi:hypothetical protein
VIVTFHQANFLPGASVIQKVLASDAVVWMDTVAFSRNSYTNRNRLPNGTWLTVPIARGSVYAPINAVRIGEPLKDWREPIVKALIETWPGDVTASICREILRSYPLLVGLNAAILRVLLDALGFQGEQHWQSHLDAGHAIPAESHEKEPLKPISERIAEMVAALGGTIYLSGPSGRNYLSEEPFAERGVDVEYWRHDGANPCALALVDQRMEVAA